MAVETTSEWVPAQYPRHIDHADLRSLTGVQPKGYKERTVCKRKRDAETLEEDEQQPTAMEEEGQAPGAPAEKRQKADVVTYRPVSGKVWKAPGQRASMVMKPATLGKKSWNKRMLEKAARKNIQEAKADAVAAAKAKRKAAAEQRKAAKERKAANQQKSAVVQKITNAATVKKMMKDKKQRKLLRTADTN